VVIRGFEEEVLLSLFHPSVHVMQKSFASGSCCDIFVLFLINKGNSGYVEE
jgi:hypothetical protein